MSGLDIGEGRPTKPGLYVAYTNPDDLGRDFKYAERRLLMWDSGWFHRSSDQKYRGYVYQWVGPLPALELED